MNSSVIILLLVTALGLLTWFLMQTLRRLNHYKGLTSDHLEDVLRLTSDPSGYMLGQNVVGYLELDDQLWVHQSNALAQEMFPDLRVGSSFLPS